MGKLLHTYNLVPTSMVTVPLSKWKYAFYVSIKLIIRQYTNFFAIELASLDLLTKPQPTWDWIVYGNVDISNIPHVYL